MINKKGGINHLVDIPPHLMLILSAGTQAVPLLLLQYRIISINNNNIYYKTMIIEL